MGKSNRQRIAESIQREQLADELRRIILRGKAMKSKKENIRIFYNRWYVINQSTIESLTTLMDQILKINTVANAVSSVGSLAEIVGGIMCIAGAISDKRDLVETGDKICKGGAVVNMGTGAVQQVLLKELCQSATRNFKKNKEYTDTLEEERHSYFQQLEGFKRELRTAEANDTLPLLLESAQREGIDFLGDLGIDENTKGELRTNLRQMCRSNAKKIKATTTMVRTQNVFVANIGDLLHEFKDLIDDDKSLFRVFSEETRKFLHENVDNVFPILDSAESWFGDCSVADLFRGGATLYGMSSAISSASRAEVGMISGIRTFSSFTDLVKRIIDIDNGSKSKESEELGERIEEMKRMRQNIIQAMKLNFGWQEPRNECAVYPALTYVSPTFAQKQSRYISSSQNQM